MGTVPHTPVTGINGIRCRESLGRSRNDAAEGFVGFDQAEEVSTALFADRLAELLLQVVGGLLGDIELAGEFVTAGVLFGGVDGVGCEKPLGEVELGGFEDGLAGDAGLVAAGVALEEVVGLDEASALVFAAVGAGEAVLAFVGFS
jgi:hypothetical protein